MKPKCYLDKSINTQRDFIQVPTARVADLDDSVNQKPTTTSSPSTHITSVLIDRSTVTISVGDLATQVVSILFNGQINKALVF